MNRDRERIFGLQPVVDALKVTPAYRRFLNGRYAILRAQDNMLPAGKLRASEHATKRRSIWEAFAKFGMGTGTQTYLGPELEGNVAGFDFSADLSPPILRRTDAMQSRKGRHDIDR